MYALASDDKAIYDLLESEFYRQSNTLEMIASENFTFPSVMEAAGSILTNKYAEGYPYKRYYGGCEFVDKIEELAISRACKLFNCQFANVQPHSGSSANAAIYTALLKPHDKILGMDLSQGGHLTHGSMVNFSGKNYQSFSYGVNDEGLIDYEEVLKIARIVKPKLIICGTSAYSRTLDFAAFKAIANEVKAFLLADIAHIAGLVATQEHPNPFPHCDIVSSTTHKTLRGPRGGIILTNDEELSTKINKSIFPAMQGGPLVHIIAAKAVGFNENLKPEFKTYIQQVKKNITILAKVLIDRGYNIVSNGTDNHLVLLSLLNKSFSGKEAEHVLEKSGITINKNTVPGETRSPFVTSGLRIGSAALTARAMEEREFEVIATYIADILDDISNIKLQQQTMHKVKDLLKSFPVYDKFIF